MLPGDAHGTYPLNAMEQTCHQRRALQRPVRLKSTPRDRLGFSLHCTVDNGNHHVMDAVSQVNIMLHRSPGEERPWRLFSRKEIFTPNAPLTPPGRHQPHLPTNRLLGQVWRKRVPDRDDL
ncbi:unconventional myosin-VIIa, partial [Lates japonicus]